MPSSAEGLLGSLMAPMGLVVTALLWGAMIPMTHALASNVFDPWFFAVVRYFMPLPFFWAMCLVLDRRSPFGGRIPYLRVLGAGLFLCGFSLLYIFGLKLSNPVRGAIVMSSGPLIATVMARVMYRQPFARGFKLALAAAVIGGALVAVDSVRPRETDSSTGVPYIGEILLIGAMISWSLYSLKTLEWLGTLGWSQLRVTFLTSLTASVLLLLICLPVSLISPIQLPTEWPSPSNWFMLLWAAFGGGGLAIVLWNFGVSRVGVPVASIYGNLSPMFAVLVAAIFFQTPLSVQQLLGGTLILAGIVRMQWLRLQAVPAR